MSKYHPINIGLSPNTERDDIALAKKLLLNPKHLLHGNAVEKLEEKFREFLPIKYAFAFRSGRSALYTALLTLDFKPGDEVLLQSYTCAAVPNAVMWAKAKPVYVDIDENNLNMSLKDLESKISLKSKAIIVQHTFGFPIDMRRILSIAKRKNLIVIEDCALSLGAKYDGRKVGTFGDISIFSFGRDKVISSVTGGIAVTNNADLAQKLKISRANYKIPSIAWTIRRLLHPILMNNVILPAYNFLSFGKIALEILKTIHVIPKAVYKIEKVSGLEKSLIGLMPNALAALALHQFKKLDKLNDHRRKIAAIYNKELEPVAGKNFKLPVEEGNSTRIYLRYNVKTNKAKEILQKARRTNIILGDWYRPSIAPHGVSFAKMQYDPDTCPVAEHISRESLNLPTSINIKDSDALKIAEFIKQHYL